MSHPVWVRGLKPIMLLNLFRLFRSHPVWVRGLKPFAISKSFTSRFVAPRVGAWIETTEAKTN